MRRRLILGSLLVLFLLASCAAGPNPAIGTAAADGAIAGFWLGLWHGMIAPITFIVSLFNDTVGVYEVHNAGGWYNFGFVRGVGGSSSSATGAGTATVRVRRKGE